MDFETIKNNAVNAFRQLSVLRVIVTSPNEKVADVPALYALAALLLECTDLSVFARTVQEAVSVPVYDINSLIAYAAFCVRRNQWV